MIANSVQQLTKFYYLIGALIAAVLLVACTHAPSADDVPADAHFNANILADGTKLFTYSRSLLRSPHAVELRSDTVGEQGVPRARADAAGANKRVVQAMLLENSYCREGYVLLESYADRTDYVIRGECRDAATAADRAKYPQH